MTVRLDTGKLGLLGADPLTGLLGVGKGDLSATDGLVGVA
jgi:hypothetical protein